MGSSPAIGGTAKETVGDASQGLGVTNCQTNTTNRAVAGILFLIK